MSVQKGCDQYTKQRAVGNTNYSGLQAQTQCCVCSFENELPNSERLATTEGGTEQRTNTAHPIVPAGIDGPLVIVSRNRANA